MTGGQNAAPGRTRRDPLVNRRPRRTCPCDLATGSLPCSSPRVRTTGCRHEHGRHVRSAPTYTPPRATCMIPTPRRPQQIPCCSSAERPGSLRTQSPAWGRAPAAFPSHAQRKAAHAGARPHTPACAVPGRKHQGLLIKRRPRRAAHARPRAGAHRH